MNYNWNWGIFCQPSPNGTGNYLDMLLSGLVLTIKTALPLNKAVTVTFTPKKAGDLQYGCAMGKMIGGVFKVQ